MTRQNTILDKSVIFSLIAWLKKKCKIGKLIIDIMPFLPLINEKNQMNPKIDER
jgi:hypothetical protein